MIFNLIIMAFATFGGFIVSILPKITLTVVNSVNAPLWLQYGYYFFEPGLIGLVIGSWVAWYGIHIVYALLEWTWKKIPGVS